MIIMGSASSEYLGSALYANVLLAYSPKSDALYRMIWIGLSSFITGLLPQDMLLYWIVYSPFEVTQTLPTWDKLPHLTDHSQDLRCMRCHSWSPTAVKNLITQLICVFREDSSHCGLAFTDLSRSITRPWNSKTDALLLQLYFMWLRISLLVLIHLLF